VFRGGHAWVFLQYLLGFRRLGWAVTFLDRLEPAYVGGQDDAGDAATRDHARELDRLMESFGLREHVYLAGDGAGRSGVTLTRAQAVERVRRADLLVNVMGFLTDAELLGVAPVRVFLDLDPGFGQLWYALGQADVLSGHDVFVTVGLNVGTDGCEVPACGIDWVTTLPPVVLEQWPARPGGAAYTSVATWRGSFDPVVVGGRRYGLRVHEFRRFLELPRLARVPCELVLEIDVADGADRDRLVAGGWSLVDPVAVADPNAYRAYIQASRAEICVAKEMYTRSAGGWFSDRSACYLASGKPVVAQDTGFSGYLPLGEGLLAFDDLDGAVAAMAEVERDYDRHARAARRFAEEHLDSDRVLGALLDRVGLR
jgi:glycosyltransferase involved in cell wall biosynthesis